MVAVQCRYPLTKPTLSKTAPKLGRLPFFSPLWEAFVNTTRLSETRQPPEKSYSLVMAAGA